MRLIFIIATYTLFAQAFEVHHESDFLDLNVKAAKSIFKEHHVLISRAIKLEKSKCYSIKSPTGNDPRGLGKKKFNVKIEAVLPNKYINKNKVMVSSYQCSTSTNQSCEIEMNHEAVRYNERGLKALAYTVVCIEEGSTESYEEECNSRMEMYGLPALTPAQLKATPEKDGVVGVYTDNIILKVGSKSYQESLWRSLPMVLREVRCSEVMEIKSSPPSP